MQKQFIIGALALVLLASLGGPFAVHAEDALVPPVSVVVPVAAPTDMNEQIKTLMALIVQLQAQLKAVQGEVTALRESLKPNLTPGTTDDDIAKVQEILAADPTLYPSGLKTGYFGPMTKEAIMKFQAKFGLEVTGELNDETRAAFETIMEQRKSEGKIPVGLLQAPGLRQKFEDHLEDRCNQVASSTTATGTNGMCMRMQDKYKFETRTPGQVGTSTRSGEIPPPHRPGEMPKGPRGPEMHTSTSTHSGETEDSQDDNGSDDTEDESDDN